MGSPIIDLSHSIPITPDTLRLLIIPAFVYAAILDYKTRRVYNEFWIPLVGLCFVALGWDAALITFSESAESSEYLFSLALSILIAPSIAFTMWQSDILGGADLKAIVFLAVFFPTIPEITIHGSTYPSTEGLTSIFTITILVNALILTGMYRVFLFLQNLSNRDITSQMTKATPHETTTIDTKHGSIIETNSGFTKEWVDIDILRMYLSWRGITLQELHANSDFYKNTEPADENDLCDGTHPVTSQTPLGRSRAELRTSSDGRNTPIIPLYTPTSNTDDLWGASKFTERLTESKNQTVRPEALRNALDAIVTKDKLWISPAIPFFIPLTVSLVISIVYGSLFTGITEAIADIIITLTIE